MQRLHPTHVETSFVIKFRIYDPFVIVTYHPVKAIALKGEYVMNLNLFPPIIKITQIRREINIKMQYGKKTHGGAAVLNSSGGKRL